METLAKEVLQAYLSDYLVNGWKEEVLSLGNVEVEAGRIAGYINVDRYPAPSDGRFHLSAQTALVWISQIGIIYGCWENRLPRKMGEVFLRDVQLNFNRTINRTREICIMGEFRERNRRELRNKCVYYKNAHIDVDHGSFTGTASFVVPVSRD
jgi:hypothetical protein